jgi:hypothetical protein
VVVRRIIGCMDIGARLLWSACKLVRRTVRVVSCRECRYNKFGARRVRQASLGVRETAVREAQYKYRFGPAWKNVIRSNSYLAAWYSNGTGL